MPACGSTTVFILMEVTHDSMKSTKNRASRAAHAAAANKRGQTPTLAPRFPNRGLHTNSARASMTNPHCGALKTAVAAATHPYFTDRPFLCSSAADQSLISLPIPFLLGGPVRGRSSNSSGGAGVAEDAVNELVPL